MPKDDDAAFDALLIVAGPFVDGLAELPLSGRVGSHGGVAFAASPIGAFPFGAGTAGEEPGLIGFVRGEERHLA